MVHTSRSPRNKIQLNSGLQNIIVLIFSLHFFCNSNKNERTICNTTNTTTTTTTTLTETTHPIANDSWITHDTTLNNPIINQNDNNNSNPLITNSHHTTQAPQCRLYLALSSIPNAGLGIYTAHDISRNDVITNRDIPIIVTDLDSHNSHDKGFEWLLDEYYWRGVDTRQHFEGYDVNVALPAVGMIGNCHAGLHNAEMRVEEPLFNDDIVVDEDGNNNVVSNTINDALPKWDRRNDPGAGAVVTSHTVSWHANRAIQAGEELFLWYGEDYFSTRSEEYGEEIPYEQHYDEADAIVEGFVMVFDNDNMNETTVMSSDLLLRRLYRIVDDVSSLFKDEPMKALGNYLLNDGKSNTISIDPLTKQQLWLSILNNIETAQTFVALPLEVTDLDQIMTQMGGSTARYSVPESIRTPQWLETHGSCMDNLSVRPSLIPQAGRGAFAVRFLSRGSRIAAVPLVHIRDRDYLDMYELIIPEDGVWGSSGDDYILKKKNGVVRGQQLLLNYCFGHPQSSLLLFPYASGVQFINHSFEDYNAEIRWSSPEGFEGWNKYKDWIRRPVDDIPLERSGLMFDIVATRDIHPEEEVLINYGVEWEEAWKKHVRDWAPPVLGRNDYVPLEEFKKEKNVFLNGYRTPEEIKVEPYPANLYTACYYVREPDMIEIEKEEVEDNYDFRVEVDYYFDHEYSSASLRPCKIYERYELYDDDEDDYYDEEETSEDRQYRYSAQIFNHGSNENEDEIPMNEIHIVHDIPHDAIRFVEKPYSSDTYLKNAFRHHIGVPDGIYPSVWLNYI